MKYSPDAISYLRDKVTRLERNLAWARENLLHATDPDALVAIRMMNPMTAEQVDSLVALMLRAPKPAHIKTDAEIRSENEAAI